MQHANPDIAAIGIPNSLTRRHLLAGAGALAFGGVLPHLARAQSASKVIDTHYHFFPPEYQKAWFASDDARKVPHNPAQAAFSPANTIEVLDKGGVRTAMLSLASTPGVWFDAAPDVVARIVRDTNEYGATMIRDYPGRFGLFATLSMIDTDTSLKEIEYAFDTLKADGVGIQSNYGDKWLGHASYRPIFDELNRRKAVVYVHPLVASCCGTLQTGTIGAVLEVPHDTTRAVTNLLLSGGLARWRDIKWLFSHGGGTIPMMAGRIEAFHSRMPAAKEFAPEGIIGELRRLYYDTANATSGPAMAALRALVPASQITYGTDYPYFGLGQAAELRKLGLSEAELAAIESGNAIRLVPRLAA